MSAGRYSPLAIGIVLFIAALLVVAFVRSGASGPAASPPPPPIPTANAAQKAKRAENRAKHDADEAKWLASPAGKLWQKHKEWDRDDCDTIVSRKVSIGFSPEQVVAAWGRPEKINRTITAGSKHEQWVFGRSYVYLENDLVTAIQN